MINSVLARLFTKFAKNQNLHKRRMFRDISKQIVLACDCGKTNCSFYIREYEKYVDDVVGVAMTKLKSKGFKVEFARDWLYIDWSKND